MDDPNRDMTTGDSANDAMPADTTSADSGMADEPLTGASNARAQEWLGQLQSMIDQLATQAAPVAKQVGAKAAELAAVAAEKAGPLAHRAAEVTTEAGQRFAERAHQVAADLRQQTDSGRTNGSDDAGTGTGTSV
jgi:hypothetical protein